MFCFYSFTSRFGISNVIFEDAVNDEDSFAMAKRLIKEEGLLIGGSCGAAVWGAIEAAKTLDSNKNVLVILPDSIRNYLSKFVNKEWMIENGFNI